ncbi:MAG: twin-arginine translocase TatA/TatE family subunit [Terracidiphilus sp.]|jgi:sec-independent protein translocase protein TatB
MGITPPIEVANLGMWDSLILMVMALVVFGPRRLPEIGRQVGKLMYEVRKASNDFKFQMEEELRSAEDADRRKKDEERQRGLATAAQVAGTFEAVSPLPEAAVTPSIAIESPYPNEAVYPPAIGAAAEATAEETYPRIQPPSTGEPVAASRPGSPTLQVESASAITEEASPTASVEKPTRKPRTRAKKAPKEPEISNG